jgi:hypothetical protein
MARPSPACPFSASPFDVLLDRLEIDDALKSSIGGEFVGTADFKLSRGNVSEQRPYGPTYKAIKVPPQRQYEIYDSRYARHFFSEAERDRDDTESVESRIRQYFGKTDTVAQLRKQHECQ